MNFLTLTVIILAGIAALVALQACKVSPNARNISRYLDENVIVERNYRGDYNLLLDPPGEWKIYQGPSPDKIDWTKATEVNGDKLRIPSPGEDVYRNFFGLISPKGDTMIVSERLIPMEGQPNLRDIGGLPTEDGRFVKWGAIYRSGKLSDLSKNDLVYMAHLGIKSIVDLRNDIEIDKDPDRYPKGAKYYQISLSDKEGKAYERIRQMVLREGYRRAKAKALFLDVMRAFADTLAADVKPVFELLLSPKETTPLLYHCTGGKDRTGYMTAMILSALGVDRKTITDDYLMSNYYRSEANIKNMKRARLIGLDAETLDYAILVRKEYMDAVFQVIDEKYGGTDAYLEQQFGLGPKERKELKKRYTESYFMHQITKDTMSDTLQLETVKKEDK
jgi:protein-tyrosine phosphatase